MAMNPALRFWDRLPPALRQPLLAGAVGREHLQEVAKAAIAQANADKPEAPFYLGLAMDLLVAAWLSDPLSVALALPVLHFQAQCRLLGREIESVLDAVLSGMAEPVSEERMERLFQESDQPPDAGLLAELLAKSPDDLFLLALYWRRARQAGDFPALERTPFRRKRKALLEPVFRKLRADAALSRGEPEAAEANYRGLRPFFGDFLDDRLAAALLAQGRKDEALVLLGASVEAKPWRVNSLLRLHDLALSQAEARAPVPGKTAVLLYSYNKAQDLHETLEQLHASNLPDVLIRALNNGSADNTAEVLARWQDRFGAERFGIVEPPVNVGAPAARNWLMSLPEVRQCDFIAYLDDDAHVPADWLHRLGAAIAAYPEAGVWGCRVVEHAVPSRLQQTDLHLLDPRAGDAVFSFSALQGDEDDYGQFSYLRPCASVTGCCHLFRTEVLAKAGPFDLRFSPTQYDDLDHDLALLSQGRTAVYQGHLAVLHKRKTGAVSQRGGDQGGSAGNLLKLKHKRSPDAVLALRAVADQAVAADFQAKLEALAASGLVQPASARDA